MSPEKRARQVQQDYVDYMERVYGELKPLAKTPEQQEILRAELERYKEGYLKHLEAYLRAKSRTMSSMIVGASNFPVERNRKALEAEQKRIEEMSEWGKRARNAIKRKLQGTKTTEQKADATFNKLKREADNAMEVLVSVDQGKSHYDKSAFRNSLAGYIRRAVDRGEFEAARRALDYIKDKQSKLLESKALKHPVFANNHSIWNYPERLRLKGGRPKPG